MTGRSMQWFVEVTDIVGDCALVDAILKRAGYKLTSEESVQFRKLLVHPKYREYATAIAFQKMILARLEGGDYTFSYVSDR